MSASRTPSTKTTRRYSRTLLASVTIILFAVFVSIVQGSFEVGELARSIIIAANRLFPPQTWTNAFSTRPSVNTMANKTPVYFVSHGGPSTMFDTAHPVYSQLEALGREITEQVKPSAVVVFSAHWQGERPNTIQVNVSEQEPLLYDFYGFPRHYYQEKYPNKGSASVAKKVISALNQAGIQTQEAERGLDHGVFVPFKIMFHPDRNPLTVPIVQVSLFDDDTDAQAHIKLGRAVEKLRGENILIVASGMSVHNLRHLMMGRGMGKPMPYAITFDAALKDAAETKPGDHRDEVMVDLLQRADARQAHPTFEHLLPIHIAVGAAGQDQGRQVWTMPEGSMAWAQYRFGQVNSQVEKSAM
ncbi:hypothetical protein B0A52_06552 [Exophiala mesophila]|uniref:Extradiol ring-cleavage dioxygenase class III enzyme subunit B domain-containing protein n=1 Tax=Exophiala mesophila TaxID=212818 RepID=A0A438N180_EXOME|nr:hypothetical protein B0A52_06552 [Exophiala mesophila]